MKDKPENHRSSAFKNTDIYEILSSLSYKIFGYRKLPYV